MADTNVSAPTFALDRYDVQDEFLVVEGRWFDVRGRRFVRPVLTTGDRRRAIAVLDHKPWVPEDGRQWVAAFRLAGVPASGRLQVAPDLAIDLPEPGPRAGGGDPQPARVARYEDPSERAAVTVLESPVDADASADTADPAAAAPPADPPPEALPRARRPPRERPAPEPTPVWTLPDDFVIADRAPVEEAAPAEAARAAGDAPAPVDEAAAAADQAAAEPAAADQAAAEHAAADQAAAEQAAAVERAEAERAAAERARAELAEDLEELRAILGRAQEALRETRAQRDEARAEAERLRESDAVAARLREQLQETRAEIEVLGRLGRQAAERAADAERQRDALARARDRDASIAATAAPDDPAAPEAPQPRLARLDPDAVATGSASDDTGEQPAARPRRTIQIGEPPPPGATPSPPSVFNAPATAAGGRADWRLRGLTVIAMLLFLAALAVLLVAVL